MNSWKCRFNSTTLDATQQFTNRRNNDSKKSSQKTTYPGVNCEDAIRPGLRPAAAAMAAMLALVGSCAAPCRAADRLEAVTITWPVPSVFTGVVGAWVTVLADS